LSRTARINEIFNNFFKPQMNADHFEETRRRVIVNSPSSVFICG